jgi:hypothetical protein
LSIKSRGIARIYDVVLACTVFLIGSSIAAGYFSSEPPSYRHDLQHLASHCLVYLDQQGVLSPMVHNHDVAGIDDVITILLPQSSGYSFRVYSADWILLWSFSSRFNEGHSASASYLISGFNGSFEPRIIVLALSW